MTRKKRDYTREILPDPKYHDTTVARFINVVMESGKRSIAEKAIYGALDVLSEKTKEISVINCQQNQSVFMKYFESRNNHEILMKKLDHH